MGTVVLVIVVLVVLAVVVPPIVMYNRFVRQRTLVDESWHDIDVELTRRYELVPNLVETVKGYAGHERAVLEALVQAREQATAHRTEGPEQRQGYEQRLGTAVGQVLARAEAYPDLKASANFLQLQDELSNPEDRIAAARRFYNGNVRAYDTRVQTFPSNLMASVFGFERRAFFELTDQQARSAPSVGL